MGWAITIPYRPFLFRSPPYSKQALLASLGITVPEINKKWAKGLFCLTDNDIKDIPFSKVPGHYEGYR